MTKARKQQWYKEALALLSLMCERWPEAFKREDEPPTPLALGIRHAVTQALNGLAKPGVINQAFFIYCHRQAYTEALMQPGATRVDLDGDVVGLVTAEERAHAAI